MYKHHGITHEVGIVAFLGHDKATKNSGIIPGQQALLEAFHVKQFSVIYAKAVTELAPFLREPVLSIYIFGIFFNSNPEKVFKDYGIETLVMVSLATDMVVLTKILHAANLA